MARFKSNYNVGEIEIPTSALPDIIFMLLFFFMVTTVLRTEEDKIKYLVPTAEEIKKVEKKAVVTEIKIGNPKNQQIFGTDPVIQAGGVILRVDQIPEFILQEKSRLPELQRDKHIVLLMVDKNVNMGIVSDVQQELRKTNSRKIIYATIKDKKSQL